MATSYPLPYAFARSQQVLLSQDGLADIVLGSVSHTAPLAVGESYTMRQGFSLPDDLPGGSWLVQVRSDAEGAL